MNKERMLSLLIPLSFLFAAFIVLMFISTRTTNVSRENGTYGRFNSCVLLIPASLRTQEKIDKCWDTVEKDTGVTVRRYKIED